tara:strand:+ start:1920 stop:2201 length:282 start_codon:yes stop_codon:yes gene_type:complete
VATCTQLNKLIKQKSQLEERIQLEKNKQQSRNRKNETRRKILVGSAVIAAVEGGNINPGLLRSILNEHTTRCADREFLNLINVEAQADSDGEY